MIACPWSGQPLWKQRRHYDDRDFEDFLDFQPFRRVSEWVVRFIGL